MIQFYYIESDISTRCLYPQGGLRGGGGIQTFPLLGPVSQKSHQRFGPENLFCVRHVRIHHQSFNNFENDTIKLSVNKAKLASL